MQGPQEAEKAVKDGTDYVGIGPVWPTGSKDISKKVLLSPEGVGGVLEVLAGTGVKAVAIGTSRFLAVIKTLPTVDVRTEADIRRYTSTKPTLSTTRFNFAELQKSSRRNCHHLRYSRQLESKGSSKRSKRYCRLLQAISRDFGSSTGCICYFDRIA